MATDVDGVFYGCRAVLPHLAKTKGAIVNTASVSGTGGDWSMSPLGKPEEVAAMIAFFASDDAFPLPTVSPRRSGRVR